ncbi:MAG TPA: hypothetical protein DEB31_10190 [Clostridiales bacterium]|nr:hypothetical protein [Clostridiales bacterium]
MNQIIPVECLIDRSWDPLAKSWVGTTVNGELIGVLTQSAEDYPDRLIPAGIVLLETGAVVSVPVEFITTR